MTDEELTTYLAITPEQAASFKARRPERWEQYRRIAERFQDVELWDKGLGPLPPGVIVTKTTRRRTAP